MIMAAAGTLARTGRLAQKDAEESMIACFLQGVLEKKRCGCEGREGGRVAERTLKFES